MSRFRQLETFIAVADAGGFNAAARLLRLSPPSVTRLIADLEERIGTRLFNRTTRQVALTEAGRRLHRDAARLLEDLEAMEASAAGAHLKPQGVLSVTAPLMFGHRFVAPLVRTYLDRHPAVSVRTFFADRVVDLIDEGLDVAVRIGDLPDSSLTAVQVGVLRRVTVAAPAYLRQAEALTHPNDLVRHKTVFPTAFPPADAWDFVTDDDRHVVALGSTLQCNTVDVALDVACAGWGVTRLLSYQVADALTSGALVEVLGDFEDRRLPVQLVYAEGPLRAAKIRAFVDLAATALRGHARTLEAI